MKTAQGAGGGQGPWLRMRMLLLGVGRAHAPRRGRGAQARPHLAACAECTVRVSECARAHARPPQPLHSTAP